MPFLETKFATGGMAQNGLPGMSFYWGAGNCPSPLIILGSSKPGDKTPGRIFVAMFARGVPEPNRVYLIQHHRTTSYE